MGPEGKPEGQKMPMPSGMVLIILLELLGILGLLGSLGAPAQFGPLFLTGLAAILFALFQAAVNGLVCFGIIKRLKWAWKFILAVYALFIVMSTFNFLFFFLDSSVQENYVRLFASEFESQGLSLSASDFFSAMMPLIPVALVVGVAINIAIMVYVFKKKDFFTN